MLEINPSMKMAYESQWKSGLKLNNSPLKVYSSCCVNSRNFHLDENPGAIYLFKVNNGNTRAMCEICSKLTNTPERRQSRSGVCIVNFEQISHIIVVFS